MTWKPISCAPRNGRLLDLGHTDLGFTEKGRWGLHRASGVFRWVDGHGNGVMNATHWDYPRVPPKENTLTSMDHSGNRWYVYHDDNGEPYTIYDRPDLLPYGPKAHKYADHTPGPSSYADKEGRYRSHTAGELRESDADE